MSAPERIWATGNKTTGSWNHEPMSARIAPEQTEYVRADLCAPSHEERVARLVDAAKRLADLWDRDAMDRIGPATRQVRAALRDIGVE